MAGILNSFLDIYNSFGRAPVFLNPIPLLCITGKVVIPTSTTLPVTAIDTVEVDLVPDNLPQENLPIVSVPIEVAIPTGLLATRVVTIPVDPEKEKPSMMYILSKNVVPIPTTAESLPVLSIDVAPYPKLVSNI